MPILHTNGVPLLSINFFKKINLTNELFLFCLVALVCLFIDKKNNCNKIRAIWKSRHRHLGIGTGIGIGIVKNLFLPYECFLKKKKIKINIYV